VSQPSVLLRKVEEVDLPILFEHQRDPIAYKMASFSPREQDAFTTHWMKILADDKVTLRTVVVNEQVAGNVVCYQHEGEYFVGYWIAREHWGKGIATMALTAFLETVKARPLHAFVAASNVASIRVLEKSGFESIKNVHSKTGSRHADPIEILYSLLS